MTLVICIGAACANAPGRPEPAAPSTAAPAAPHGAAISSSDLARSIAVATSTYGRLVIEAPPEARCQAKAELPSGGTVLAGDFLTERKPDADGRITWAYATPVAGAGEGSGHYILTCAVDGQTIRIEAEYSVP